MKMKKKSKLYLMSMCVMLFSVMLFAQKDPEPPSPPGPPGLPIDGGLGILLAAGVAYGVYEKKRKK